jgi:phage baseplate assembly protein V
MLKFGKISEVDASAGRARVVFQEDDNTVSHWLPMMQQKTSPDKFIIPFDTNEHVVCLMDEHAETGVILGAIYDNKNAPDEGAEGKARLSFVSGLCIEYDRNSKALSLTGTGDITINITGNVNVKSVKATVEATTEVEVKAPVIKLTSPNVQVSGNMTVVGDLAIANLTTSGGVSGGGSAHIGSIHATSVTAGTVSLESHTHIGVKSGPDVSGPPQ